MTLTTETRAVTRTPVARRDLPWVGVWLGLLSAAVVVGVLYRRGKAIEVGAVPWVGRWGFDAGLLPRLALAGAALAAATMFLPLAATRLRSRFVVASAVVVVMALTALLAWAGPDNTHWVSLRFGYGAHTHLVDDWHGPAEFLSRYVRRMPFLTAHLRAHPPGLVLALWSLGRLGLEGRWFDLVLMLAAGGASTAAALVTVRNVAGDAAMRAAAPFVAVGPVLVWRTNPDVIFAALALSAVAMFAAATVRESRRADLLAMVAGAVFGVALLFTYGVMLMALPMAVIAWHRRSLRPLVVAAATSLMVIALPAFWGFSWLAGLLETRVQYAQSIARVRGYRYWLLGNAAIYAALLGPAIVVALARLRDRATKAIVWGGLASAVAAGISGLSSAETERIWQPFVPLVLVAGAALWLRPGSPDFDISAARRWLTLQSVVALGFQTFLWTRV